MASPEARKCPGVWPGYLLLLGIAWGGHGWWQCLLGQFTGAGGEASTPPPDQSCCQWRWLSSTAPSTHTPPVQQCLADPLEGLCPHVLFLTPTQGSGEQLPALVTAFRPRGEAGTASSG